MIRTQIYLTEEEYKGLKKLSAKTGRPQSELIRDAVDNFLANSKKNQRLNVLQIAKGLWKERTDLPDIRKLREEFDRING